MSAKVNLDKCDGCGTCIEACSFDAIKIENKKAVIGNECSECGNCIDACPKKAISLI